MKDEQEIKKLKQIRCLSCNKLLAKAVAEAQGFQIKCPRCGALNDY